MQRIIYLIAGAFFLLLVAAVPTYCQEQPADGVDRALQFPLRWLDKFSKKQAEVSGRLEKQTTRYLNKLSRQERKLQRQLTKLDSSKAKDLFAGTQENYQSLTQKMQNASSVDPGRLAGNYIPYFDSIKTSLKFLNKNEQLTEKTQQAKEKLQSSIGDINQLQNRLKQTEEIKAFVKQRKSQIKEALSRYTNLPKGLSKSYGKLSKDVYYYQAQVQSYKDMINDPDKIEQKALALLNKLPAFQSFMKQNSMLSGLFQVKPNNATSEALAGLQTREQVQQLISSRIGAGGVSGMNAVQQQLQSAKSQLSQLKQKVNELGGSSSEIAVPDFKPNSQKTKSFLKRIELGNNLQTVKKDYFFPTTTDVGASAGYKVNDKSLIGLGASYKFGLGRGIRDVNFTSEGIGLRSFVDYKLKGSFWVTGGAEWNYRARFENFEVLKNLSGWQQSALIGISKKYQINKKVKGNAQLLYDLLWKQQIPRTQAVVFRIGYSIK